MRKLYCFSTSFLVVCIAVAALAACDKWQNNDNPAGQQPAPEAENTAGPAAEQPESAPEAVQTAYRDSAEKQCCGVAQLFLDVSIDDPRQIMYDSECAVERMEVYDEQAAPGAALTSEATVAGWGKRSYWACYPKRHFLVTMNSPASLLGLPSVRQYLLVPSYADRTLMRNAIGYSLAAMIGMQFAPAYRFVELYLNGQYWGLYLLSEYLPSATGRMGGCQSVFMFDVGNGSRDVDRSPAGYPTDGCDKAWDREDASHFYTAVKQFPVIMHHGSADMTEELLAQFEKSLYQGVGRYTSYINMESLAQFYLLEELTKDMEGLTEQWEYHPGYNLRFGRNGHPKYIYAYVSDGRLCFGPGFMFEYGTLAKNGSVNSALLPFAHAGMYYPELIFNHPELKAEIASIWHGGLSERLKPETIAAFINGMASTIAEAVARDNRRWNITNNGASDLAKYTTETNADTRITWRAAVQRMVDKYGDTYAAVNRNF